MDRTVRNAVAFFAGFALVSLLAMCSVVVEVIAQDDPPEKVKLTEYPITYTRFKNATDPVVAPDGTVVAADASYRQNHMDVVRIRGNWVESDLIRQDEYGDTYKIYDCETSSERCAAQHARYNPSATKIVFNVITFKRDNVGCWWDAISGVQTFRQCATLKSEIWVHDLATKTNTRITSGGFNDITPNWASDDIILFSSDRAGKWPNRGKGPQHYAWYGHKGQKIYRMNADGTNIKLLTPGAQMALSPEVGTDGYLYYATWQGWDNSAYNSTPTNVYWIERININGGHQHGELGWHFWPYMNSRCELEKHTDSAGKFEGPCQNGHFALRPPRQISNNPPIFCAVNYYRGNHDAQGFPICWELEPGEGALRASQQPWNLFTSNEPGTGHYAPSSMYAMAPWSEGQDSPPMIYKPTGKSAGRMGYVTAYPGMASMSTWHRGHCYKPLNPKSSDPAVKDSFYYKEKHGVVCQKVIVLNKEKVNLDPYNEKYMKIIACGDNHDYQCFNSSVEATYQERFGIPKPPIGRVIDGKTTGQFAGVNAFLGELYQKRSVLQGDPCALGGQGCKTDQFPVGATQFCIQPQIQHDQLPPPKQPGSPEGLNGDFAGYGEEICVPLAADGSFLIKDVDCTVGYRHSVKDKDHKVLAGSPQVSIWPGCGERTSCHGCHDGASEERMAQLGNKSAGERFKDTVSYEAFVPGC